MSEHSDMCLLAIGRINKILDEEFKELTPPDRHFVLSMLAAAQIDAAWKTYLEGTE